MRSKSAAARVSLFASVCIAASTVCPIIHSQQSPSPSAPPPMLETLNNEAQASDPAGIHKYSQVLIQYLLVKNTYPAIAASLADRLARAELMARQKRRKLVSEADIAEAFNVFLREIGAPAALTANVEAVHNNRIAFEGALPSVISQKANGRFCKPGEAVWVVSTLIANVGLPTPPPSHSVEPHVAAGSPPVQRRLELFYASHSRSKIAEAFDHLFNHLHI